MNENTAVPVGSALPPDKVVWNVGNYITVELVGTGVQVWFNGKQITTDVGSTAMVAALTEAFHTQRTRLANAPREVNE